MVFICHGFAEHMGYYDEFAVMLANLNMVNDKTSPVSSLILNKTTLLVKKNDAVCDCHSIPKMKFLVHHTFSF
jgi:hypothetical protein